MAIKITSMTVMGFAQITLEDTPYKVPFPTFPFGRCTLEQRLEDEVIYVAEHRHDATYDLITGNKLIGLIEQSLDAKNHDELPDELIRHAAIQLHNTLEWQSPETLLDELGVEYFIDLGRLSLEDASADSRLPM